MVLGAQDKIFILEMELFVEIREKVACEVERVQKVAHILAVLDALQSMAEMASAQNYIIPEIAIDIETEIIGGRQVVRFLMLA